MLIPWVKHKGNFCIKLPSESVIQISLTSTLDPIFPCPCYFITPSPLTANSLLSLRKCLLTENPRSAGISTFFTIAFLNTRHHYWIPFTPCLNNSAKSTAFLCCMYFPPLVSFQVFLLVLQYKQDLSRFKLHFVLFSLPDILVSLD